MKRNLLLTAVLLAAISANAAVSQWVAFNDHYRGPNTGSKVSAWTLFTTQGGAPPGGPPGNFGFLTNSATGAALPVTMAVTNVGAAVGNGIGAFGPNTGTPAALAFTNYIDFVLNLATNLIHLTTTARVAHVFRGCDTSRRYSWRGTAVRGGGYQNRWTLVEVAAAGATPAHASASPNTYFTTSQIAALTPLQAVCNFAENRAAGMLAGWDDIEPNPDGTITVFSSTWRGTPMPGTNASDGLYGYAVIADRLEEFIVIPDTMLAITNQPRSLTVPERGMAAFTVGVSGAGAGFHWSRGGVPIPGVSGPSYTINSAAYPGDDNAQFQVIVSNSVNSTASDVVTLTVTPDAEAPVPILAVASADGTNITVSFNEPVSLDSTNPSSFYVSPPDTEPAATAARNNGTNIVITLLAANALVAGQNYSIVVNGIKDISALANTMPVPIAIPIRRQVRVIGFDTDNVWKYAVGTNLTGKGWETVGYDDSAWPSGPAGLGLDASVNGVPIRTTIAYSNNAAYTTTCFRRHFTLPSLTNGVDLTLRDVVEDGAVYWLNGQELYRHNMPAGTIMFATTSAATQADPTPIQGPFSLPLTGLVPGDNVLAVEVHQHDLVSSDVELAVELTAEIPQYLTLTTLQASIDSGTGQVTLTWTDGGTLEEATALLDGGLTSWSAVDANPASPYTFTPTGVARFYRVR